jgi:predicted protein tyrosine phosphatase
VINLVSGTSGISVTWNANYFEEMSVGVAKHELIVEGTATDVYNLPVTEIPLIIDARSTAAYEESHIIGAINCTGIDALFMLEHHLDIDSWDSNQICVYGTPEEVDVVVAAVKQCSLKNREIRSAKRWLIVHCFGDIARSYPFLLTHRTKERFGPDSILCNPDNEIFLPSAISTWGLYLGSDGNASKADVMSLLGIDVVINVSVECKNHFEGDIARTIIGRNIRYAKLHVVDDCSQDMEAAWTAASDIMEDCRRTGRKVLVHCHAGRSRSASTVIYYLMTREGLNLRDALNHVESCRPQISPNPGFMRQLRNVEVMQS